MRKRAADAHNDWARVAFKAAPSGRWAAAFGSSGACGKAETDGWAPHINENVIALLGGRNQPNLPGLLERWSFAHIHQQYADPGNFDPGDPIAAILARLLAAGVFQSLDDLAEYVSRERATKFANFRMHSRLLVTLGTAWSADKFLQDVLLAKSEWLGLEEAYPEPDL